MSGKVSGQVWGLDLPRNERDVLLALADHADDFGRGARPSISYIAWKVGISERETIRCLKWLRAPEHRIIEVTSEPGFHKPTCYQIFTERAPKKTEFHPKGDSYSPHSFNEPIEKGDTVSPIEAEKGDQEREKGDQEREKGDQEREKGDQEREKGDNLTLKGDRIVSPEPLLNRSYKPLFEPLKVYEKINPSISQNLSPGQIWQKALGELQCQLTKATFDTWVKPTSALSYCDDVLRIQVRSPYAKQWLEGRLCGTIERTVNFIVGHTVTVQFEPKPANLSPT